MADPLEGAHANMRQAGVIGLAAAVLATASIAVADRPPPSSRVDPDVSRQLRERGEPVVVWVMLTDKCGGSSTRRQAAMSRLQATYGERAVARRQRRRAAAGLFDERDLPVDAGYLDAIRATGASIRVVSRWLNGASVTATTAQIHRLAALPFVKHIQLVGRGRRVIPDEPVTSAAERSKIAARAASPGALDYGNSHSQLEQINVIVLHDLGYTGSGLILALLDTGFYKDHESIAPSRIVAEWDFVNDDGNTQDELGDPSGAHSHGTKVISIAAGAADGMLYGPAYEADLILCKTEDISQEQPIEEDWFVAGLEFAEQNGADVVSSSLGYIDWYTQSQLDGQTAVTTIAVNVATANGMFCCTAAGNEGTAGLLAPADAFEVITVGSVTSSGTVASTSSRGPTADGRVKPEVVARGALAWGASSTSPTSYSYGSGTSFATPLVSGTVICLLQAHPDWTIADMRTALFETADYYVANGTFDPTYARGYGLIDALAAYQALRIPGDFDFDRDVDVDDVGHFLTCVTGPALGPPATGCADSDLDLDGDADQSDFGLLQRCYTGAGIVGDPACAG